MPSSSDLYAAVAAEISRHFNELRSEGLDHREKTVDWWLIATGVYLAVLSVSFTLLGIVAVVAGYFGFKEFRKIKAEGRANVESARAHAEEAQHHVKKAQDHLKEIENQRDKAQSIVNGLTAEMVQKNPDEARRATENVLAASEIDRAVAAAVERQQGGSFEEAIEKWRSVAIVSEGIDNDRAALAWLSVGYLIQKHRDGAFDAAIDAYNEAIRLKPDLAAAYNNRGTAKSDLGRHEEAIADYGEAIRLKRDFAEAYSSRGNAKDALRHHQEAIKDHDEALRLKPDYAEAYYNRGNAKSTLGRHEEAIADYGEAIRLKSDHAEAYYNRGVTKNDLGDREEAIADLGTAIDLARASGNDALASDAERALKGIRNGPNP